MRSRANNTILKREFSGVLVQNFFQINSSSLKIIFFFFSLTDPNLNFFEITRWKGFSKLSGSHKIIFQIIQNLIPKIVFFRNDTNWSSFKIYSKLPRTNSGNIYCRCL
jgi:hypothetical protein